MGRGLKWTLIDEWNSRRQASEKVWGFPEAMDSGKPIPVTKVLVRELVFDFG
jgi:hypothetical protein